MPVVATHLVPSRRKTKKGADALYVTSKKCCGGYVGSSLVNMFGKKQWIT
jgi:hypothetical protein